MRSTRASLVLAATLGLLAAGCGLTPTARLSTPACFRARDAQADTILAQVRTAWSSLNTTQGTVSFWEKQGSQTSASKADFFWSRPEKLRANILEADSVTKRNAKLVYLGDGKITVKVAFIKKTLSYDDPQVLSMRGYRIDQTDLTALTEGLLDPKATVRFAGTTSVSGRSASMVELTGAHALLADLPKVVVCVDDQVHLPLQVEGSDATGVVFRGTLAGLVVNPTLPPNIFNL